MARPLKDDGLIWRKTKGWCTRVQRTVEGEKVRPIVALGTTDRLVARAKRKRMLANPELLGDAPAADTADDYAEAWLAQRETRALRTAGEERRWWERYWKPAIGALPLREVRSSHIRAVLVDYASGKALGIGGEALSRASLGHLRGAALRMFDAAWQDELISENPVARVKLGGLMRPEERKERAILTDDELRALLAHPDVDLEIKMLVLIGRTVGGMRAGDLNALNWTSFGDNFTTCRVPRRKTRTKRASQVLEVPELVRPFLTRWWAEHGSPAVGPVFPVRRGRRAGEAKATRSSSGYAKRLRTALERALGLAQVGADGGWQHNPEADYTPRQRELLLGTADMLPVDFHSTRRAYTTALARAGVNAQTAQVLAGHSDAKVHQRYVAASTIRELPAGAVPQVGDLAAGLPASVPNRRRVKRDRRGKVSESLWTRTGSNCRPPDCQGHGDVIADPQPGATIHATAATATAGEPCGVLNSRPCQTDLPNPPVAAVVPLPVGGTTAEDLRRAVDEAIVAGDMHRARRLLAELGARMGDAGGDAKRGAR